jgi:hypothetical protein
LRKSNGVATIKNASTTTVIRKNESDALCGTANPAILFRVPGFSFWFLTDESWVKDLNDIQVECIDIRTP